MSTFAEYLLPSVDLSNSHYSDNADLNRSADVLKPKNPSHMLPSPQNDYFYPSYQPVSQNDCYYQSMNTTDLLPGEFGFYNGVNSCEQLAPYLNCAELPWIPSFDSCGLLSQPSTDFTQEPSPISWGQLCPSPQQSSDSDGCPSSANMGQFPIFTQSSLCTTDRASSISSNNPNPFYVLDSPPQTIQSPYTINTNLTRLGELPSSPVTNSPINIERSEPSGNNPQAKSTKPINSKTIKLLKNREAAAKCRKKKREYMKKTKSLIETMYTENAQLEECVLRLREEIVDMKLLLANIDH